MKLAAAWAAPKWRPRQDWSFLQRSGCAQLDLAALAWLHARMLTLSSTAQMRSLAGTTLGLSDWHEITQQRITAFAAATEDFEAIHLDRQAAVRQGFGDVIAHGLYTLSLGPKLMGQIYQMPNFSNAVNYGYDRVRFMSPVGVGCSIRLKLDMTSAEPFADGTRFLFRQTFEMADAAKPACVADFVSVYYDLVR